MLCAMFFDYFYSCGEVPSDKVRLHVVVLVFARVARFDEYRREPGAFSREDITSMVPDKVAFPVKPDA